MSFHIYVLSFGEESQNQGAQILSFGQNDSSLSEQVPWSTRSIIIPRRQANYNPLILLLRSFCEVFVGKRSPMSIESTNRQNTLRSAPPTTAFSWASANDRG